MSNENLIVDRDKCILLAGYLRSGTYCRWLDFPNGERLYRALCDGLNRYVHPVVYDVSKVDEFIKLLGQNLYTYNCRAIPDIDTNTLYEDLKGYHRRNLHRSDVQHTEGFL